MANSTQENKRVLASRSNDMAQYPSSDPSNQFVVDINNCAVVIVGDNNVINVDSSALSNSTELQRKSLSDLWSERVTKGDAKIGGLDFTEKNMAKISQKSRRVPCCTVEMLVQEEKSAAISTISPVVKRKQHNCGCVDGERKCACGIEAAAENLRKKKRCNRKRRKSQGCNPNYTTSSSAGEDRREATLNELSFENDSSTFQHALQSFHCCLNALRPLLMNGRWAEFERLAEELLFKDDTVNPTHEIIVVLEKSLAFGYRMNDLERAEDMMNNAVKKIEQTSGSVRLLLEVFSKSYLASLYRRRKMFGKAETCLEVGRKVVSGFPPCLPVMLLLYQLGSFKMEIASMFPGSRTEYSCATEGKKLLESCIKMCVQLDGKSVSKFYEQLAVVKIARMNLNCETSVSRNKDIIRQNIVEAEERLGTLETEFCSDEEIEVMKIYRQIAKMDLCYRLEEYHDAEEIAQETLELIEKFGFQLELTSVQERLIDIRRKVTESLSNETFSDIPKIIDSCSSTNNSPNSSVYYTCSSTDANDSLFY